MDNGLSVPRPPADGNSRSGQILVWTKRVVCLSLVFFGACTIWMLGDRLYNEVTALSNEWSTARDREPIGYVGISSEQPEMKPSSCIRKAEGKVYLWAGSGTKGQAIWFDVSATDLPLTQFVYAFGRDRIKAIDYPIFQSCDGEIARRIYPERPVLGLVISGIARAYPLTVMEKVEVVNDWFKDQPVTVACLPLMNQTFAYQRSLNGEPVSLGSSGYCYQNAFVLYDRATDSLWHPKPEGLAAITGPLVGKVLPLLDQPLERVTWGDWLRRYPDTQVLVGGDRSRGIPVPTPDEVAVSPL